MGKKRKRGAMTQAEIWDDSALLRSWQEALDEYQFYHSIHARGENVEDVLRQADLAQDTKKSDMDLPPASTEATVLDSDVEDGEVDESGGKSGHGEAVVSSAERESLPLQEANEEDIIGTDEPTAGASVPTKEHDVLENMKMAYWWAGYYSGLYEAQQNTHQPSGK